MFYAAARVGVPVVPVALHGTGAVMGKGATDMASTGDPGRAPQRVYICIGAPLIPQRDGPEPERASELCGRTRAAVIAMHRMLVEAERQGSCATVARYCPKSCGSTARAQ